MRLRRMLPRLWFEFRFTNAVTESILRSRTLWLVEVHAWHLLYEKKITVVRTSPSSSGEADLEAVRGELPAERDHAALAAF